MKIGLLCSSPVVYGAMSSLFETGNLAGVAAPSTEADFVAQLEGHAAQYQFKFKAIDLSNLEDSLLDWIQFIEADVVFVFMFAKRIPASALSAVSGGFINFHGGKLPQYRSPVPDFWMIRNGETQGMLTAHRMEDDFDAGPIIHEVKIQFSENETSGTLISKFGQTLGYCMERTVEELEKGTKGKVQNPEEAHYYPRPKDTELLCDFQSMEASEVHALVRAAIPRFKGALTHMAGRPVRIVQTTLLPPDQQCPVQSGIVSLDRLKQEMWIGCARNSAIRIDVVDLFEGIFSAYRFAQYTGLRHGEII